MRILNRKFTAPVAIVAASTLLLTACSDSSDSSDAGSADTNAAAEETTTEAVAVEYDLPGKPDDFEITPPNTTLKFGETANVVLSNTDGTAWAYTQITFDDARDVTPEEANANAGQEVDSEGVEVFKCYDATIKVVHVEKADPEEVESIMQPMFDTQGANGRGANSVMMGGKYLCGLNENDELPSLVDDINPDREYKASDISYIATEGGIPPEAATFQYNVPTIEELSRMEYVIWN